MKMCKIDENMQNDLLFQNFFKEFKFTQNGAYD